MSLGVAAVFAAFTLVGSAWAQTKTQTTTTKFGGWSVVCNEGGDPPAKVCSANFQLRDKKTKSTIFTWLIGKNNEKKLLIEYQVPTEVLIGPGVRLTLDEGEAHKADYVYCGKTSCRARIAVDDNFLAELQGAKKAKVEFAAVNGKMLSFGFEVQGLEQALASLNE
jgi:invasion protein IalB